MLLFEHYYCNYRRPTKEEKPQGRAKLPEMLEFKARFNGLRASHFGQASFEIWIDGGAVNLFEEPNT